MKAPLKKVIGSGETASFVLKNPAWKWILGGIAIGALGASPYLLSIPGPRADLMRYVFGPLLLAVGAWTAIRGTAIAGSKEGSAVVTSRLLTIALPGHAAEEIRLESIRQVWHVTQRGSRAAMKIEREDEAPFVLASIYLDPADELSLSALVLQRAALRRAGVTTGAELAAAEAYKVAEGAGQRPLGVAVRKAAQGKYDVTLLTRADSASSKEGMQLFIPRDVLRVMQEDGSAPEGAKPLRGVDA